MSRRKRRPVREEHTHNHEAWVIPYADLLTLLLAFFVVLYAISSVNAGKYRVLSNALFAEFTGAPRTSQPIQVGDHAGAAPDAAAASRAPSVLDGHPQSLLDPQLDSGGQPGDAAETQAAAAQAPEYSPEAQRRLARIADDVTRAMGDLIRANLVVVRRHSTMIEVELRTDILYPSGSATLSRDAVGIIQRLAVPLAQFPNPIRVEGHTDDLPINTSAFASNWELSSARAATVVHLLASSGLDPSRLSVVGKAEFSPSQPNSTPEGRNANRRVLIVIQSGDGALPPPALLSTLGSAPSAVAINATGAVVAHERGTVPAP